MRVELQPDISVTVTEPDSKRADKTATAEMGIPAQDIADIIAFVISRPQRVTLKRDPRTPHCAGHVNGDRPATHDSNT